MLFLILFINILRIILMAAFSIDKINHTALVN